MAKPKVPSLPELPVTPVVTEDLPELPTTPPAPVVTEDLPRTLTVVHKSTGKTMTVSRANYLDNQSVYEIVAP